MPERVIWGGRYVIHDVLASGGMATVYLAARLGPSTEIPAVVALKRLSDQYAKQPEFVAMFLDEAHLAARIRHPNVVTTYEFLRTDEGLGIVMDLVVGESLMALTRGRSEEARVPPPSRSRWPSSQARSTDCTPRTRSGTTPGGRSTSCTATSRRTTSS